MNGFLHLLEPEARLEILTTRADLVARKLAHLREMRTLTDDGEVMSFARRVLQFHEQQARQEIDWLRGLIEETRAVAERSNT